MLKNPPRKLLAVTASVGASVTLSGCLLSSGNLMPPPPRCPDGGVVLYSDRTCADACEPGTEPSRNYDYEAFYCYPIADAAVADADADVADADIADADDDG